MTVKEETLKLTSRQREGRAINTVAELLRRTLSVPNIYLEPPASLIAADILAVDRGGAGDLHAVEIKLDEDLDIAAGRRRIASAPRSSAEKQFATTHRQRLWHERVRSVHRQLMEMPSHYRYLAISAEILDAIREELLRLGLFPEDGIGRLGVITIRENGDGSPTAEIAVAPERFRVDPAKLKAIETKLLARSRPDIEVRI